MDKVVLLSDQVRKSVYKNVITFLFREEHALTAVRTGLQMTTATHFTCAKLRTTITLFEEMGKDTKNTFSR